jgi:predicted nuclease of restriction endonuclease-like (RecB) superfamily
LIMRVDDGNARNFYLKEATEQSWSVRQLERNINTFYYQRLLSSKDKSETLPAKSTDTLQVSDFIKDPYVFEFLDILQPVSATEKEHFYIDLVFYNYILKCFLLIDLKAGQLKHQDIGQMDMYRRMFDDLKKPEGDNPTICIILCADRNETVVKYSILKDNENLFATKFMPYLPTEEELVKEIEAGRRQLETKDDQ